MSGLSQPMAPPGHAAPAGKKNASQWWRTALPVIIGVAIALLPAPEGLAPYAWHYFALFAAVVAALILEPLPNPAIGVLAVSVTAALAPWVLASPAQLADPKFNLVSSAANWAFSGFASTTVWLVGGAFMFAHGYEKTGLGRRIALSLVAKLGKNTLSLGYASVLAEALLAIVTPSNTARGAGTVYPVVANLPPLYQSMPDGESRRKIGSYVLYTAFCANTITSTLFVTGCAPNFLALDFANRLAGVHVSWFEWFLSTAPFALPLLLVMPLIVYWVYPPQIKRSPEVAAWARGQLREMGPVSRREITLAVIVICAVLIWIFGGEWMDGAIAAFLAMSAMLVFGVVKWADMAKNHTCWSCVVLLATLVAMAAGLGQVGFIKWFAQFAAAHLGGMDPTITLGALVAVYFLSHYMFASLTAHTTAMYPVMMAVGLALPGLPADKLAMALAMTTGLTGVITPYATGSALPYYNSGYIKPAEFWGLGFLFGALFLAALLFIGVPVLMLY